eukprot:TRINITY_DN111694_c0_g1_i1.p1 TRINITY_DN111694_c0_g1~~TRINITY_DN111694_c0_g1_i1.p1  ORF type:complete len:1004 (+),score=261.56 TRINITY_DN111694_c0_g1_i1:143-3154(+)
MGLILGVLSRRPKTVVSPVEDLRPVTPIVAPSADGTLLAPRSASKVEARSEKPERSIVEDIEPDPEDEVAGDRRPQLSESEVAEVLAVMEIARAPWLRKEAPDLQRRLAEAGELISYKAGTRLGAEDGFLEGRRVVLTGSARVVCTVGGTEETIALLRRGDSFGLMDGMEDMDSDAWMDLEPEIIVEGHGQLRACQLHDESQIRAEWEEQFVHAVKRARGSCLANARGSVLGGRMRGSLPVANVRGSTMGGHGAPVGPPANKRGSTAAMEAVAEVAVVGPMGETSPLGSFVEELWSAASPSTEGLIGNKCEIFRAHFIAELWAPFLAKLEEHKGSILKRRVKTTTAQAAAYFPLRGQQIIQMRDRLLELTEIWYGARRGGNLSCFYSWFVECMELLGVVAYSYNALGLEQSKDGWATGVDGATRTAALKAKSSGGDPLNMATGGLAQKQGRSAIDNTVLRNVFQPEEAHELLFGPSVRKMLVRFLVLRQRVILKRLSEHLQMDLLAFAGDENPGGISSTEREHRIVQLVLSTLKEDELRAAGVDPESMCLKMLRSTGQLVYGFAQLGSAEQKTVWTTASTIIASFKAPRLASSSPSSRGLFQRFTDWCRDHPGDYYEGDKRMHSTLLVVGMWCKEIVVIKRSAMEQLTMARYFPMTWMRTKPLVQVLDGNTREIRHANIMEMSSVRANECPYMSLHGMSLCGGAFIQEAKKAPTARPRSGPAMYKRKVSKQTYSIGAEMQWVQDPSANIENWYLTDIEKIVNEAWQLNPHATLSSVLPGETFVNVGQNPKVGSSIKRTQHTQLAQGKLSDFPVLSLVWRPQYSKVLDASLDLVTIEPPHMRKASKEQRKAAVLEEMGLFLRIVTQRPAAKELLSFLVELRLRLLSVFGGGERIDFLVTCMSDECGGFIILFAPIPQLVKLGDEPGDYATWMNPFTGENSDKIDLAEARIDFGKGVGHFLMYKATVREQLEASGEDMLRRLWCFNRVPGVRPIIEGFMIEMGVL